MKFTIMSAVVLAWLVALNAAMAAEVNVTQQGAHQRDIALRMAIFTELTKSGSAQVTSYAHTRYCIASDVEDVRMICDLVTLLPHRIGWFDVLHVVSSQLDDNPGVGSMIDEALFGHDSAYEVKLWDSPKLSENLKLLSRLPEGDEAGMVVYTKWTPEQLFREAKKANVRVRSMQWRDFSELSRTTGRVGGIVVDKEGKPIEGATVAIAAQDGKHICDIGTKFRGRFRPSGHTARSLPTPSVARTHTDTRLRHT